MLKELVVAVCTVVFFAASVGAEEQSPLKTEKERVNYAIGVFLVNNLKQQGIDFDLELVLQGMKDAGTGKALLLSDAELDRATNQYQRAVRKKQGSKAKQSANAANQKIGEAFLAANSKQEGVVQLPSGLQYKVITVGKGKIPGATDSVEFNYRAMLLNKKEFESSYKTGEPVVSKVNGEIIPALQQALAMMPVGSKWELFVPASLAYGEAGNGGDVAPNSALLYEVELLAIR